MADVVIYGRPECCLCDDALEVLQRVRARLPFVLREQNIEQDEALLRRYLERIPVVTIDGVEAFELFVDEAEFARQVSLALTARRPQ
ncbi:MAG TPA: glutaredoxin family protein [Solirubrobacteraceae bacterium]